MGGPLFPGSYQVMSGQEPKLYACNDAGHSFRGRPCVCPYVTLGPGRSGSCFSKNNGGRGPQFDTIAPSLSQKRMKAGPVYANIVELPRWFSHCVRGQVNPIG